MSHVKHFAAVPLFLPVLAYCLGIVSGNLIASINLPLILLACSILLSIIFHFCGYKLKAVTYCLILFSFFCFGNFRYMQSYYCYNNKHIIRYCQSEDLNIASLRGVIIEQPKLRLSKGALSEFDFMKQNGMSFRLRCESIKVNNKWQPVSGIIQVYTGEPMLELSQGMDLQLTGNLYSRQTFANRSPVYCRRSRIIAACSVDNNESVQILPSTDMSAWNTSYLTRIRNNLQRRLGMSSYQLETDPDSILAALLLGQRAGISSDVKEAFIAGGTMHFLSLSGLHVGMLTGLVWLIIRPFRISRFWQGAVPALLTLAFMLIVPARAPVLRAGIISIFFCLGYIVRRKSSPVNLLLLSAFLILIFRPLDIFDAGFQLSFSIVLALVIITPSVFADVFRDPEKIRLVDYYEMPLLDDRPWHIRYFVLARKFISAMLIVSIVAWVVSLPLIAWHFNRVSWFAPINSMLMAIPVAFTMLAGLLKIVVSLLLPVCSNMLEPVFNMPGRFLIWLAQFQADIPLTCENVASVPVWLLIVYLVVLSSNLCFAFIKQYLYLRWSFCVMIMCLAVFIFLAPFHFKTEKLRLHFLPVGHGCASIIELPDGSTMLYDCGSYDNFSLGEYAVVPYLRRLGCNSINAAFISHSDLDHYSALPDVAQRIPIDTMLVPVGFGKHFTVSDKKFMELMNNGLTDIDFLQIGDRLYIGNIEIDILWPRNSQHDTPNESSMVIKIISSEKSILLCGDITPEVMLQLLREEIDLSADIMLLPHHGELSDVLQDFVDAVSPSTAILSARTPSDNKLHTLQRLCPELLQVTAGNPVVIE